jgi:hypothetical protein
VHANRLSRLGCRGMHTRMKKEVRYLVRKFLRLYFTYLWGRPSQPIPTIFDTTLNLSNVNNRAKCHIERNRGFGLAVPENRMFP